MWANLFTVSFTWHTAFMRKWSPEETALSIVLVLMKSRQSWRNKVKEYEVRVVNWGTLARPGCSDFSQSPFVFGDKDAPLLQVRAGLLSPESFRTYFTGEGWGKVRVTFPLLLVSQTASAGNIHYAKVPYLGLGHPEPHWDTTPPSLATVRPFFGERVWLSPFLVNLPAIHWLQFLPFGVERKGNRDSKVLNWMTLLYDGIVISGPYRRFKLTFSCGRSYVFSLLDS